MYLLWKMLGFVTMLVLIEGRAHSRKEAKKLVTDNLQHVEGNADIYSDDVSKQEVAIEAPIIENCFSSGDADGEDDAPQLIIKLKPRPEAEPTELTPEAFVTESQVSAPTSKAGITVNRRHVLQDEQILIVTEHNAMRANVNPPAENMRQIHWNEDLAAAAEKLAHECREVKHDDPAERRANSHLHVPVGQNYALGPKDTAWTNVIRAWYNENADFKFGIEASSDKVVGHYTQQVRSLSGLIGCGSAYCENLGGKSFYCNYQFPNMNLITPYTNGTSCELCKDNCVNKLCDCGDINCQYGGITDLNTCTCECQHGFTGEFCGTCPDRDMSESCRNDVFQLADCTKYTNVIDFCPIMCGACPEVCPGVNQDMCKNGGTFNTKTCGCDCTTGYTGPICECKSETLMADTGPDPVPICGRDIFPYAYPATRYYCAMKSVVATCPRMCNQVLCNTWSR